MGTTVRMAVTTRRSEQWDPGKRYRNRRRWRFRPRGLIGMVLAVMILINLYVLADNVVCLIKKHREERALARHIAEQDNETTLLRQQRDYMQSTEYLRDSAHSLGYSAPGDPAAEEMGAVPAEVVSPVKRKRLRPSPPY